MSGLFLKKRRRANIGKTWKRNKPLPIPSINDTHHSALPADRLDHIKCAAETSAKGGNGTKLDTYLAVIKTYISHTDL